MQHVARALARLAPSHRAEEAVEVTQLYNLGRDVMKATGALTPARALEIVRGSGARTSTPPTKAAAPEKRSAHALDAHTLLEAQRAGIDPDVLARQLATTQRH